MPLGTSDCGLGITKAISDEGELELQDSDVTTVISSVGYSGGYTPGKERNLCPWTFGIPSKSSFQFS